MTPATLAEALLDALPQTQCRRCGYADCRSYAEAIATDNAPINRCPPGGAEGIARLARISARPLLALDSTIGREGPRSLASIDEAWCIGCTLCIKACPVDCIVGAPKQMHTVIEVDCTGCELCVPACPVDCIAIVPTSGARTGWQAWSAEQAGSARARYALHQLRIEPAEYGALSNTTAATVAPRKMDSADAAGIVKTALPALSPIAGVSAQAGADPAGRPVDPEAPGHCHDAARKQALVAAALARAREARQP